MLKQETKGLLGIERAKDGYEVTKLINGEDEESKMEFMLHNALAVMCRQAQQDIMLELLKSVTLTMMKLDKYGYRKTRKEDEKFVIMQMGEFGAPGNYTKVKTNVPIPHQVYLLSIIIHKLLEGNQHKIVGLLTSIYSAYEKYKERREFDYVNTNESERRGEE